MMSASVQFYDILEADIVRGILKGFSLCVETSLLMGVL